MATVASSRHHPSGSLARPGAPADDRAPWGPVERGTPHGRSGHPGSDGERPSVEDTARLLSIVRSGSTTAHRRTAARWELIGNYRPLMITTIVAVVRSFGQTPTATGIDRLHNEAAIRLIDNLHRFDGGAGQFGAWCRVVVRHLTISLLSTEARRARHQAPASDELAHMASIDPRPDEQLEASEADTLQQARLTALDAALERLRSAEADPKDRERYHAFYLRHQEGLTFAEIAAALHISESSARNRHREARQRLRQFVDDAGGAP